MESSILRFLFVALLVAVAGSRGAAQEGHVGPTRRPSVVARASRDDQALTQSPARPVRQVEAQSPAPLVTASADVAPVPPTPEVPSPAPQSPTVPPTPAPLASPATTLPTVVPDPELGKASCGCQSACGTSCLPCGGCCPTGWIVNADVLFMTRNSPYRMPLVNDQTTGAQALNANALNYNHQAMPYIQLIRPRTCRTNPCQDCCWDWDIGYFGIQSWNDSVIAHPPNSPVLLGPGVQLPSSAPGNLFQFSNGTDLQSAEFNARRQVTECLTVLAGFRWLELSDHMVANEIGNGLASIYRVDTNNHLYGFQIGANHQLWNCGGRFHIDGITRAGIYYNRADQDTDAPVLARFAPLFVDHAGARTDHTAFLGQLGLVGQYHLTSRFALRAGYQLMWLDGVALAPDQLAVTNLTAPGSADVATGGSLFFHGALVGLQAQW